MEEKFSFDKAISNLFESNSFYDVTFIVGSNQDKETFYCHKLILSLRSEYWQKLFFGANWKEVQDKDCKIEIPDIRPSIFQEMMRYIYCNQVKINSDNLLDIFICADKYLINGLRETCEDDLINSLDSQNCLDLFHFSESYNLEALSGKIIQFIIKTIDEVLKIHNLSQKLSFNFVLQIISSVPIKNQFDILCSFFQTQNDGLKSNQDSSEALPKLTQEQIFQIDEIIDFRFMAHEQLKELKQLGFLTKKFERILEEKNQEENIPIYENLICRLEVNDLTFSNDGIWKDKSGFGNNVQKHPKYELPTVFNVENYNGKSFKVMRFKPSCGMIFPDKMIIQQPFTIMIVDRYCGSNKGRTLQSRYLNWLLGKWSGHNGCFMEGWIGKQAAHNDVFSINTCVSESNQAKWYLDGILQAVMLSPKDPYRLGICGGGKYSSEVSDADIAEILIWNRKLSGKELKKMHSWLGNKFGVNQPNMTNQSLVVSVSGESGIENGEWKDESGFGFHAQKHPNCELPKVYNVENYNGKSFKVMRFKPSCGMIFPDNLVIQQPFTVMIVDRYYGAKRERTLQSRDLNWLLGKWGGVNGCFMEGWIGQFSAFENEFTINTATLSNNQPKWYFNGKLSGDNGGISSPYRLGICGGGKYNNEVSDADIAEILIWNYVLSDEEREKQEKLLSQKYGIQLQNEKERDMETQSLIVSVSGESGIENGEWKDESGFGFHAQKHPSYELPKVYNVENYNGKSFKVMRFKSSCGMIFPDKLVIEKPFTIMIVDRYYGAKRGRTLQSRDLNWLLGKWSGKNGCFMEGWIGNEPVSRNDFTINTATLSKNEPKWYLNGELLGITGGSTSPYRLGICRGGKFNNEVSDADIAEILIWNYVLSDEEREKQEKLLSQKYGIKL
ncbi:speckle-type poz protein [Anaeramoeba ignava]|uniref:Speckle-type poz protein n=1 Tax=Anaeramoeba ignava TaxID=1746090 RepID=A0A9Q0LL64_ANAIG|nr:speckle-type poz protein [Anaeramoeba ignava]